jgi:hypothetical protein
LLAERGHQVELEDGAGALVGVLDRSVSDVAAVVLHHVPGGAAPGMGGVVADLRVEFLQEEPPERPDVREPARRD